MLHPIYALRDTGISTEYSHHLARIALNSFIERLPGGKETYERELKAFYLNLYSYYLKGTQCRYFLDKTPRYHLIIDELMGLFPHSKFIILLRNPLAVLGSIIHTWTKRNWPALSEYKHDLIHAIDKFAEIMDEHRENILIFHYEELISSTEDTLDKVFGYLGLEFEEGVLEYRNRNSDKWVLGDQGDVYEKGSVDSESVNKWQDDLGDPQYWRVMYDYLLYIGEEKLNKLGYDFSQTLELLEQKMPAETVEQLMAKTRGLAFCLNDTDENRDDLRGLLEGIDQKVKAFQSKNAQIEELKNEINGKNIQIESDRNELRKKDDVIDAANRELEKQVQVIAEVKRNLDDKQEHLVLKQKKIQEKEHYISKVKLQLEERNKQINVMRREICEKDQELKSKTLIISKKVHELEDIYSSNAYKLGRAIAYPFLKIRKK